MELHATELDGCLELGLDPASDDRGLFLKLFQVSAFEHLGLQLGIRELFVSRSHLGVVRGLHFQLPPKELVKLVICLNGSVFDVVVDLRVGSPTYGHHATIELDERRCNAVFVPKGCAHGFATTSDEAVVAYAVSEEFDPECDSGIHWGSAGITWPVARPIVSERDEHLVPFDRFESPFVYERRPPGPSTQEAS